MSEPIKIICDMKIVTCQCGSFYGVPVWVNSHRCPICSDRSARQSLQREIRLESELKVRDRTIASLRGAITRLKRRK